ncbi:hypothetical protein WOLCODRAFT_125067 [Wolfiporia cocos MD-104 SS10]|uniref:Uncharacterized protein n=1 Tax=Wolfiporia cocos (strain MD-104) TaxID=742152 RepID=A0A2H3IYL5_WOLCO|nr:hypothetical protein WOLCODRAFT_125067 [Wolfiporia cocos MD-104 SS10]
MLSPMIAASVHQPLAYGNRNRLQSLKEYVPRQSKQQSIYQSSKHWQPASHLSLSARREWNADLPIHRIPSEVLIQIFLLVRSSSRDTRWIWVSHVCGIWRGIAIMTPLLWSSVSTDAGLPFLRLCLQRAKHVPTDVTSCQHVEDIGSLKSLLMPRAQNIRTLTFRDLSNSAAGDLIGQLGRMTRLEKLTLHIASHHHSPSMPVYGDSCAYLDRLTSLSLKGVNLHAMPLTTRHLLHLELVDAFAKSTDPADAISQVLRNCPRLVTISVSEHSHCSSRADSHQKRSADLDRVQLPNLQRLQITAVKAILSGVLTTLILPTSTVIEIRCLVDVPLNEITTTPILTALSPGTTPLAPLANIRSVHLFVSRNIFRLRASNVAGVAISKDLNFEVECSQPIDMSHLIAPALCDLSRVFSCSPITHLQVFGDHQLIAEHHWRGVLAQLPRLTHVEIGSRGEINPFFAGLCPSNGTPGNMPCTQLRNVVISGAHIDRKSIKMVAQTLSRRSTRPLEYLVLRSCSRNVAWDEFGIGRLEGLVKKLVYH